MTNVSPDFKRMALLYAQTKCLAIKAEEIDPASKSNVAVFKEFRDAFDHVMRYADDCFAPESHGDEYRSIQIDKAIGHILRAAYDSLDGIAISLRVRIGRALDARSREAIAQVCPKYFTEYVHQLSEIDECVRASRKNKDIGTLSIENMNAYMSALERQERICREIETSVPDMVRFDREQRNRSVRIPMFIAISGALLGALFALFANHWLPSLLHSEKPTPTTPIAVPSAAPPKPLPPPPNPSQKPAL